MSIKIVEMPIEWQQRSANTFSVPMPVRETAYSHRDLQNDIPSSEIHPAGTVPEDRSSEGFSSKNR